MSTRRELTEQLGRGYRRASRKEKGVLLDEFVETGYLDQQHVCRNGVARPVEVVAPPEQHQIRLRIGALINAE